MYGGPVDKSALCGYCNAGQYVPLQYYPVANTCHPSMIHWPIRATPVWPMANTCHPSMTKWPIRATPVWPMANTCHPSMTQYILVALTTPYVVWLHEYVHCTYRSCIVAFTGCMTSQCPPTSQIYTLKLLINSYDQPCMTELVVNNVSGDTSRID